jgi:hypothetical protein
MDNSKYAIIAFPLASANFSAKAYATKKMNHKKNFTVKGYKFYWFKKLPQLIVILF